MRKFRTKAKIHILIFGLVIIAMIMVAGNVSLVVNKASIEKEIDGCFNHDISVGPVYYVFPNYIFLKDIDIRQPQNTAKNTSFKLSGMVIRFSFFKLFLKGAMDVSRVSIYPSTISYYALSCFLEENFQEILEIIRNSPGNDIDIRIKESLLDFDRKGRPDYIATAVALKIRDRLMETTGYFRADQYGVMNPDTGRLDRTEKGEPLWFKMKSQMKFDGLQVDRLVFKNDNLHAKLWGGIRGGIIKVNGFTFVNTLKKASFKRKYSSWRYFNDFPEKQELRDVDTYILDIDGQIKMDFPKVNIEKFDFSFNNMPVALKGDVTLGDPVLVQALMSLGGAQTSRGQMSILERTDINMSGAWKDNKLNVDGEARIDFADYRNDLSLTLESAKIGFDDLLFYFDKHNRPAFNLAHGNMTYWTNRDEHKITLDHVRIVGNAKLGGIALLEINAPFYDGMMNSRLWIDSAQHPPKITSRIVLANVDTDAMEELMIHFANFNGRMSSEMIFTNFPEPSLQGDILVRDGTLTDFAFFNWVSDSFRLPDLKAIGFDRATARFLINEERIQLQDIRLETDDVRIGGYFGFDDDNLVASKLYLSLSQELLQKSPKFRPILKMFDETDPYLGFGFQLSGNLNAMNFQWLPSEAKTKIQSRIPDFIERMIEKDVDDMMEPDAGPSGRRKKKIK